MISARTRMCWGAQAACLHPPAASRRNDNNVSTENNFSRQAAANNRLAACAPQMKRKRLVVLGATGSIGESAAKVARDIPERVEIVGIAANSKARELAAQANELRPPAVCIVDETKLSELRANLKDQPQIFSGETGLREIASAVASDMVLVAIVGTGGLRPALAAIQAGKDLAVASKEILVMAGEIVMREAREKGVHVLPVDSEHNAIFQCLEGRVAQQSQRSAFNAQRPTSNAETARPPQTSVFEVSDVRRIILT